MSEKPLLYVILGSVGSGRRDVLTDLVSGGLAEGDRAAVMISTDEKTGTIESSLPGVTRWKWTGELIEATLPEGATHVFFVTDGRSDPIDQLEVVKPWIEAQGAELARVLCVIDCQLAEKNPGLLAWFDACVHFADVVLLNRREGVANKWMSDFLSRYKAQFLPCLFETVKAGRVKNPALVLEPQARRMSHAFDDEQDLVFVDAEGEEIDEEAETDGDEEIEATPEVDPYFERRNGGRRVKELPDIRKFLAE
jgi:hypothetical protein